MGENCSLRRFDPISFVVIWNHGGKYVEQCDSDLKTLRTLNT